MRTRALLCAAALAAGAVTSMAQNVYSLNVVGYVNYAFSAGNYVLVSNPLDNTNNDLNTIIPSAPDGSTVQLWSTALQDFAATTPQFSTSTGKWFPTATIAPGQGFFVVANGNFTNTFVGNVRQGPVTINLVGSGNYECIGSTVPLGGGLTNVLAQYPALDGDTVQIWSVAKQDFNTITPQYSTATAKWFPDYNFNVGDGFFIIRNGAGVAYTRSFTVQ